MRDLIVIVVVLVVFGGLYFGFRDPPQNPPPPQQQATNDHSATGSGMPQTPNLPTDYNGLVGIGNKSMDEGNFPVAAECYGKALAINGGDSNVRVDYGVCLHSMGLSERGLEEFRKVLTTDDKHTIVRFNAGIVHNSLGAADSAKIYFDKYLAMDPNGPRADAAKQIIAKMENPGN